MAFGTNKKTVVKTVVCFSGFLFQGLGCDLPRSSIKFTYHLKVKIKCVSNDHQYTQSSVNSLLIKPVPVFLRETFYGEKWELGAWYNYNRTWSSVPKIPTVLVSMRDSRLEIEILRGI